METPRIQKLKKSILLVTESKLLNYTAVILLLLPLAATAGQFIDTGFLQNKIPILLFFWPGENIDVHVYLLVWLFMGVVFLSYVAGIIYLVKARSLAKIILITLLVFVVASIIRTLVELMTGWKETTIGDINGTINEVIVSLWHNPIWEEIIFRGIPLLILILAGKLFNRQRRMRHEILYIIIPSILCGLYHIPGHGMIRFFDSIFISMAFAWMALRFTLFAPIVMHYVADAMLVMNLDKVPLELPLNSWLALYGNTLNSVFTLLFLIFIIAIPFQFFLYYKKVASVKAHLTVSETDNSLPLQKIISK